MDIGTFRGVITALLLILFIGLVAWAWSRRRIAEFDAASRLPLSDDGPDYRDKGDKERK